MNGSVVLDCTALEYLSSAGLGVLLKTQKRLKAAAGALRLTGVNRHVHDIFRYAGFDQIFDQCAAGNPVYASTSFSMPWRRSATAGA